MFNTSDPYNNIISIIDHYTDKVAILTDEYNMNSRDICERLSASESPNSLTLNIKKTAQQVDLLFSSFHHKRSIIWKTTGFNYKGIKKAIKENATPTVYP